MEHCRECGFVYEDFARADIAPALRWLSTQHDEVLNDHDPQALRAHPLPDVWSPLEYACHMRDVYLVHRERVLLTLDEAEPAFAHMRRDERVIEALQRPTAAGGCLRGPGGGRCTRRHAGVPR
jgi:hypothetical protein